MLLTLDRLIQWERLRSRPFAQFDPTSETDRLALVYVCTPTLSTFHSFLTVAPRRPKDIAATWQQITDELTYISQFQPTPADTDPAADTRHCPLSEVAEDLIAAGLPPRFVLTQASLIQLPLLCSAVASARRQLMEGQRLWTWITILPHVDSSRLRRPQSLLTFPWEENPSPSTPADLQQAEQQLRHIMAAYGVTDLPPSTPPASTPQP